MASFSKDGFYLIRNMVYEVTTKNNLQINGRLIDIEPDTLFFTNFFNENAAKNAGMTLDTVGIYYRQLDKLKLIADRAMGFYNNHSFDNFDFQFQKTDTKCSIPSDWEKIFQNDDSLYELVAHLTSQGINILYEEEGRTYYFYGGGMIKRAKPDRSKMDTTYDVKNFFWFTPNKVEKINGLALGLHAENIKNTIYNEKDSLIINGINLEINPFALLSIAESDLSGPYSDSIEFYNQHLKKEIETTVNGGNFSAITMINEAKINGLNISGLITVVDEINGLSISGLSNFAYKFNGLSIGLHNKATSAKGLQIGLINKSENLRGFQIGLWNKNGRKSLPFINWQFRKSKKKKTATKG